MATAEVRKAVDSIYDYTKVLITLATGTIALSATLLAKPSVVGKDWLIASWCLLGLSMLAGLAAMGFYISMYLESEISKDDIPWKSNTVQLIALIIGIGLLATFAVQNITSSSEPTSSKTPSTSVTTTTSHS